MEDYFFISVIVILVFYILLQKSQSTLKQVKLEDKISVALIVNKSLNMSTGKILAQLGHALFNIVSLFHNKKDLYETWKQSRTEVVLYQASIEEIKSLSTVLHKHNIRYNKIIDAGRTQVPSGSNTILIIGPGNSNVIDNLLSHLPLYSKN
jgi:PTH2 family peptidyl-tRNA hydrolase